MKERAYLERPTTVSEGPELIVTHFQRSITLADAGSDHVEVQEQVSLDEAIKRYAEAILERNKITPEVMTYVFAAPIEYFTEERLQYFQKYASIAVHELVRGAVDLLKKAQYEEGRIVELLLHGYNIGNVFVSDLVFHDIMHTVVQAGMSGATKPEQVRPTFQRDPLSGYYGKSDEEFQKHKRVVERDEVAALLWFRVTHSLSTQRADLLRYIEQSKTEEEFIRLYFASFESYFSTVNDERHIAEMNPWMRSVFGRVYREYATNPALLFQIFEEATQGIMNPNSKAKPTPVSTKKRR